MDKSIEIKRRAQRCLLAGDLAGALAEYEKLAALEHSDPYNYILLADLTYKKGQHDRAYERYMQATDSYEKAGLYKNAIAVCKKMIRLKLSTPAVLKRLAVLHALDGLVTESALYWMQYAEYLTHEKRYKEACECIRQAYEACPENVRTLEKLAEVQILGGDNRAAAGTFAQAAWSYQQAGAQKDADRCRKRADHLHSGAFAAYEREMQGGGSKSAREAEPPRLEIERTSVAETGSVAAADHVLPDPAPSPPAADAGAGPGRLQIESATQAMDPERLTRTDFDTQAMPNPGRHVPLEDGNAAAPQAATRPEPPQGLRFAPPEEPAPAPAAIQSTSTPAMPGLPAPVVTPSASPGGGGNVAAVESLLKQAEAEFRSGDRDAAGGTLMRAARSYEDLGRLESAAVIYRSLTKSPSPPPEAATAWLQNAERRGRKSEAAEVACEIGDRALNDGDAAGARAWFERARALDPASEHAQRRLSRLGDAQPSSGAGRPAVAAPPLPDHAAAPPSPAAPPVGPPARAGELEVTIGNSGVVAPDLSSLLSEFQKGVESLIADDAQGNYDLGMAYREMKLPDQAVQCFRIAARNPAFTQRCAEMIGRSMYEQGQYDRAADELATALSIPGLDVPTAADLRFLLGLAKEGAGRPQEALAEFERVYAQQPGHPEVAQKIRLLRRALEGA